MLRLRISKNDWEKLTPAVQELYNEDNGEYALQVQQDGRDEVGPLKRALERVKAELQEAREARTAAEAKIEELDTNDARKRGDIEMLTRQWEKKLADAETARKQETEALQQFIRTSAIDAVVTAVTTRNTASKENAQLLDPHVRRQLSVEFVDGTPQVMMQSDLGPIPLEIDKFEKSVVDNPAYKAIIVENRASGGGATDSRNSGQEGGAFRSDSTRQQNGVPDLATVDPRKLVEMLSKR